MRCGIDSPDHAESGDVLNILRKRSQTEKIGLNEYYHQDISNFSYFLFILSWWNRLPREKKIVTG